MPAPMPTTPRFLPSCARIYRYKRRELSSPLVKRLRMPHVAVFSLLVYRGTGTAVHPVTQQQLWRRTGLSRTSSLLHKPLLQVLWAD
jgi:hypothetical protein